MRKEGRNEEGGMNKEEGRKAGNNKHALNNNNCNCDCNSPRLPRRTQSRGGHRFGCPVARASRSNRTTRAATECCQRGRSLGHHQNHSVAAAAAAAHTITRTHARRVITLLCVCRSHCLSV